MSGCATREQLERFLCDRLDAGDLETITEHLEGCAACALLLDDLTRATPDERRWPRAPEIAEGDARLLEELKAGGPRRSDLDIPEQRGTDGSEEGHSSLDTEINSAAIRARTDRGGRAFPSIDGFRIIREVGRGGMGVVYEAEEERLSRRVALKVLSAGAHMEPKHVLRFEREARAAARLHHTNIVPVYGVSEQNGHHYYLMQYIEGKSLAAVLDELVRERSNAQNLSRRGPTLFRSLDPGAMPTGDWPRSDCRWPRLSTTRIARASCIATSSRPTCSRIRPEWCGSPTLASRKHRRPTP